MRREERGSLLDDEFSRRPPVRPGGSEPFHILPGESDLAERLIVDQRAAAQDGVGRLRLGEFDRLAETIEPDRITDQ
jgi:hypothetical protein